MNYSGADAGSVVIGFGIAKRPEAFDYYRISIAHAKDARNCLSTRTAALVDFSPHALIGSHRDYTNEYEEGIEITASLPAGDYAICDFTFHYNPLDIYSFNLRPAIPFYLPFTVQAGKTIDLGNLQAHTLLGRGAVETKREPSAVVFLVTDRKNRDVALARSRVPGLPQPVINGTLDVATHHASNFITPEMQRSEK